MPHQSDLTPSELDVLTLVAKGRTAEEIAAHLGITARTFAIHTQRATCKLKAANGVHAVALAVRDGPIDP